MNDYQKYYYREMLKKGRLIPIYYKNKMSALITFFLGDNDNRKDMWELPKEDINSTTINIDHLISKDENNKYHAIKIWHNIKEYFKTNFPNVKIIKWKRVKEEKNVYT